MLDRIQTHLLDILQNDPNLFAGGETYQAGWSGVQRISDTMTAQAGYVNLFDESYSFGSKERRPAVYLGLEGMEALDKLDYPTCSGMRSEQRVCVIPLVLIAQGDTKRAAKRQRNQLRANVRSILFQHWLEQDFWYCLTMPGEGSGGANERVWASSSGSGDLAGQAEAMAILPVKIQYTWLPNRVG